MNCAKHICEYVCLRAVVGLFKLLPYRSALFAGWLIAWPAFHIFRFRVREAVDRIHEVFGDRFSQREARKIAWRSWRNFVFSMVDMARLPLVTTDWIKSHVVDYEQTNGIMEKHCRTGKGAILASPHMGSWEITTVMMQLFNAPIFFVAARQRNPLVTAYIERLRGATGIDTVLRGSSLVRSVIRRLRHGEVLGILPDVRIPTQGLRVRFLGKEANVGAGMALFARQCNIPIHPLVTTRIGWTRHHIRFCPSVWPNMQLEKRKDQQRMTQEVFNMIEQAIEKHPAQWFWFNKRWILEPVEPVR